MATYIGTRGILKSGNATPNFLGDGTWVQCMFQGQFNGGTVFLEVSSDNGTEWYRTGDNFTSDKGFSVNTFKTLYRFAFEGTTGAVQYWIARNSL